MAKVRFNNRAKYNGVFYNAGEVFEVAAKDVKAVEAAGAIVEEKPTRRKAADENPDENPDENLGDNGSENDGDKTPQE